MLRPNKLSLPNSGEPSTQDKTDKYNVLILLCWEGGGGDGLKKLLNQPFLDFKKLI